MRIFKSLSIALGFSFLAIPVFADSSQSNLESREYCPSGSLIECQKTLNFLDARIQELNDNPQTLELSGGRTLVANTSDLRFGISYKDQRGLVWGFNLVHPVLKLNQYLAKEYCRDWEGRIPTEAELKNIMGFEDLFPEYKNAELWTEEVYSNFIDRNIISLAELRSGKVLDIASGKFKKRSSLFGEASLLCIKEKSNDPPLCQTETECQTIRTAVVSKIAKLKDIDASRVTRGSNTFTKVGDDLLIESYKASSGLTWFAFNRNYSVFRRDAIALCKSMGANLAKWQQVNELGEDLGDYTTKDPNVHLMTDGTPVIPNTDYSDGGPWILPVDETSSNVFPWGYRNTYPFMVTFGGWTTNYSGGYPRARVLCVK